ncbi:MAG: zinc-binding alcohol dehydrogenase family protein, partial [Betaproteobacteria bacterium]
QIVGEVDALGSGVQGLALGQRIGVPWLGWTCGACRFCRSERENLCPEARFTGYQLDGGFCERAIADARFCFPLPEAYGDAQAAPLLCAGLIGYRALRMTGSARTIGLYGFGAAAHIVIQVARHEGRRVLAFTRTGDAQAQAFALSLGAAWAGASAEAPPEPLDAAILFAPAGELVPAALRAVDRGGTVVCAGIHMSDVPSFPYRILWEERVVRSVANLTRRDGEEFLALAPRVPVRTEVETFPLASANDALARLRSGTLRGAAVLVV